CVIDGCPPGLALAESDLQPDLDRRKPGSTRLAPIKIGLEIRLREREPRWAAIDHSADRGPVRLAEVGDLKQVSKGRASHGSLAAQSSCATQIVSAADAASEKAVGDPHAARVADMVERAGEPFGRRLAPETEKL